jgi:hypothetical protein
MTVTRAGIAFLFAAIVFAVAFILDLAAVNTGRIRLMALGAFALAIGLLLTQ